MGHALRCDVVHAHDSLPFQVIAIAHIVNRPLLIIMYHYLRFLCGAFLSLLLPKHVCAKDYAVIHIYVCVCCLCGQKTSVYTLTSQTSLRKGCILLAHPFYMSPEMLTRSTESYRER